MNNFKFLLIGTSLSFIPLTVNAQCVATQDCATLGYTETSCNGGKGVKCPFGNKWFCFETEEEFKTRLCPELGFTLDCSGKNQTGSNYSCNGKYNYCNCHDGYTWKNGTCEQIKQTQITDGAIGDLYYCNGQIEGIRIPGMEFFVYIKDLKQGSLDSLMLWNTAKTESSNTFCGKGRLPTLEETEIMYMYNATLNTLFLAVGGYTFDHDEDEYYWTSSIYEFYGRQDHYIRNMLNGDTSHGWESSKYLVRPVVDAH